MPIGQLRSVNAVFLLASGQQSQVTNLVQEPWSMPFSKALIKAECALVLTYVAGRAEILASYGFEYADRTSLGPCAKLTCGQLRHSGYLRPVFLFLHLGSRTL